MWKEKNDKYIYIDEDDREIAEVYYDEEDGWTWMNLIHDWGECGYYTAEEAMEMADLDSSEPRDPWFKMYEALVLS